MTPRDKSLVEPANSQTHLSKRSAEGPAFESSERSKRRALTTSTDQELRTMAEYIVSRMPEDTLPDPRDWEAFAELVSLAPWRQAEISLAPSSHSERI